MKQLVLNIKTWNCGEPCENDARDNCNGEGETRLLNEQGYMCCLGQFAVQLGGLTDKDILDKTYPKRTNKLIPLLTQRASIESDIRDSPFSDRAVDINDGRSTTVEQKIKLLTKLCKEYGFELTIE